MIDPKTIDLKTIGPENDCLQKRHKAI